MSISDNYNREELIAMVSDIFCEELAEDERKERAALWELADHTSDSQLLSELSVSQYLEVRESVAYMIWTGVTLLGVGTQQI